MMEFTIKFTIFVVLLPFMIHSITAALYSNLWAVLVKGGESKAREVADKYGFVYVDRIMDDYYHFYHHKVARRSVTLSVPHQQSLSKDPNVLWFSQQEIKRRVKRDVVTFNDEKYKKQWYLHEQSNKRSTPIDMNVPGAWKRGFTGKGVVVTILDDGIERTHPDLAQNYDPKASWDINDQDSDPTPRYDFTNENRHGTRCAGEVAAIANNTHCGVGVAYEASIGGIRMLDGDVTDSVEAMSLSLNRNHIDIYSASWGPDDDGKTVDGPAVLARRAFREGVMQGRNGKGSIFVWASGNGGRDQDNCNCDGYTNSIYTLSVSSATENGHVPWYSEACSSTLVSTFSSGDHRERQITTTDLRKGCTDLHTGTSASAPLAAGIVALTLQANAGLTWRDVQYIAVLAASPNGLDANDWVTNGVGRKVSHHFGFGMMDAGKMVELALNWTNIPEQHICEVASPTRNIFISALETKRVVLSTSGCAGSDKEVKYIEHVQAKISLTSSWRGDLQIWLTSPSGTRSTLLTQRVHDNSGMGFNEWAFLTTHNWGEQSKGDWILEITNGFRAAKPAVLRDWTLVLYGTATNPLRSGRDTDVKATVETIKEPYTLPTAAHFSSERPQENIVNVEIRPTVPTPSSADEDEESDDLNHIHTESEEWDSIPFENVNPISNSIKTHVSQGAHCPDEMLLLKDQCVDRCPDGYYPDTKLNNIHLCLPCHSTCATCSGGHNFSCSECYHGSKLVQGQCILLNAGYNLRTGSAASANGLSPNGLKSVIFGATSTLGALLIVLIGLVIYYVYNQHKLKKKQRTVNHKSKPTRDTVYTQVTTQQLSDSKHSSQQELMDSDVESSNQDRSSHSSAADYNRFLQSSSYQV